MLTFSYITFLMSCVTFLNTNIDGLFTYHVMGWRKIPSNFVGGKQYPILKCRFKQSGSINKY